MSKIVFHDTSENVFIILYTKKKREDGKTDRAPEKSPLRMNRPVLDYVPPSLSLYILIFNTYEVH